MMTSENRSKSLSRYLAQIGNCKERSFYYPQSITSMAEDEQIIAYDALIKSVVEEGDARAAMTLGLYKYKPSVPALVALRDRGNLASRGLIGTALCQITGDVSYLEISAGSDIASMFTINMLESIPGLAATNILARGLRSERESVRSSTYGSLIKQLEWQRFTTMPDGTESRLCLLERLNIQLLSHDPNVWELAASKLEILISQASSEDASKYEDQLAITWVEDDELRATQKPLHLTAWGPIPIEKIAALDSFRRQRVLEILVAGLGPQSRVLGAPVACVALKVPQAAQLIERAKTTQTEAEIRRESAKGLGNCFYPGSAEQLHFNKFVEQCDIALGMLRR